MLLPAALEEFPAALEALPEAVPLPETPETPELPETPAAPLAALPESPAAPAALLETPATPPGMSSDLVVLPERVTAWELLTLSRISRALAALVWPGLKLSLAGMSALRTEKERSGCETP